MAGRFRNYSSGTGADWQQAGTGSAYWVRAQRPSLCVRSAKARSVWASISSISLHYQTVPISEQDHNKFWPRFLGAPRVSSIEAIGRRRRQHSEMDSVHIVSVNKSIMLPRNMPTSVRRIEEQYSNLIRNHIMIYCIFFHHDQYPLADNTSESLRTKDDQALLVDRFDDFQDAQAASRPVGYYSFLALERAADSMRRIAIGERRCALRECHQARIHR